jgi:hypothetical protein
MSFLANEKKQKNNKTKPLIRIYPENMNEFVSFFQTSMSLPVVTSLSKKQ